MKRFYHKLLALVICLTIIGVIFPQNTLADTIPLPPTNLTATVLNNTQIYLSWNPASGATAYYIYRATSPDGYYTIIGNPTTTNYTDSSISMNVAYYYKITAANAAGTSADSSIVYTISTSSSGAPAAPTNLIATATNSNQIYVSWSPVSNASYYYVYRSTSVSGTYSLVAGPTTTNYTDYSVTSNAPYYYKVRAVNSAGTSSDSSIVYAIPANSNGVLSAPTNLSAQVQSSNQVFLTWAPVGYATYYNVYRSTSYSGPYSIVGVPSSSPYTDTSVSANTTYYYKVVAGGSTGTSAESAIVYATTTTANIALTAPVNLTASFSGTNQVYLTWSPVNYANYYSVYRATSVSGPFTMITAATTSNYTDSAVQQYTTYYYKVQAVNSAGSSPDSLIASTSANFTNNALSAPTDVMATVSGSTQINLTWDPVSNATCYYVFRSTSSTGTYSIVGEPTTTNYTDSGLSSGITYYYKVEALGNSGSSPDSAIVPATTTYFNGAITAPTNLSATPANTNQIYLTWSPVSNATYYNVYRSTSALGSFTVIGAPTTTNYTDSGLSSGITYYYKVVAVGSVGSSADSAIVPATTTVTNGALTAPTNPTATALSTNQIYLTWDLVSNATSYYVYRATSPTDTYTNIATISTTNYTDSNLSPNTTYYYKIQAAGSTGLSTYSSVVNATTTGSGSSTSTSTPTNISQISSQRLAGQDSYGTAAEVAKAGWLTSYYAVIVSGETFSDALCSAPLANKYNAPLLLTTKDSLNADTKQQLSRLKVKSVFIVGGAGVISSAVEQTIESMGIQVTRIAGNDSYETSVKIAQALGQTTQAVVASGETFPDALSIAPIAAMKGMPILLTTQNTLPDSVKTYLKGIQSTYVVGGTGVISDSILSQLPSPTRLSGQDRYDTNISVLKAFAGQLDFSTCYISTGENYADALAGSVLASITSSPLILVSNPVEQSTLNYTGSISGTITKEVVFGGTAVVPDSVLTSLNGTTNVSNTISAPTIVTASPVSSNQINLSWDAVSGATSYYIYGSTSSTGAFSHIATVTTNSYSNTGLWANTTYYYKVQAVNASGTSQYSPVASAATTN
ncbi:cell wall-binding protein [Desulfosporosinus acidiphilus SJ4]|uniref:Cell wall-binding protein n=1 Tax=Desulfosporosinus acidiphilus (strain DSM 22704 / JCM 16185 / SJ4) TaxID=646529 RepID=I4DBN8_DESAJ|nr:cell wall-binding repeat-containing protein [Desulfosporosinus acidiphilus]AFM43212.1 cell wall-binding protein [Desulfosporosinus acidiphilus SJ4]